MIEGILKIISEYFEKPIKDLLENTRKREIVQIRQLVHFFVKRYTHYSLEVIGSRIGGKDHATVLHSIKAINNLIETDKDFKKDVENIDKIIKKSLSLSGDFIIISRDEIKDAIICGLILLIINKNYEVKNKNKLIEKIKEDIIKL